MFVCLIVLGYIPRSEFAWTNGYFLDREKETFLKKKLDISAPEHLSPSDIILLLILFIDYFLSLRTEAPKGERALFC